VHGAAGRDLIPRHFALRFGLRFSRHEDSDAF
jgi:hypothetical protein